MHNIPLSGTSPPCNLLFLNPGIYGPVQATRGVGTVLIWDFCVAITKGGGAHVEVPTDPPPLVPPQAGPPDLTVPGFGVPIGSAYLSARRTFGRPIGRPKVRPYLRPADSAGRKYGRTFGQPIGRPKVRPYLRPADRPAESTAVPSAGRSAGRRYGLIRHPPL